MGTIGMGWNMGWEQSVWDGNNRYGMGTIGMGWEQFVWDGNNRYGMGTIGMG